LFDNLFSNVNVLQKGLDASWLRNKVISNNIANVDTPGFKSSSVSFESAFKTALAQDDLEATQTRAGHRAFSDADMEASVVQDTDTTYRMDGNNVNIDAENAALAKNQIYYNTLVQQLTSEFNKLDLAINEGR